MQSINQKTVNLTEELKTKANRKTEKEKGKHRTKKKQQKKNLENNNYFTENRKEKRKHSKNKINPTQGSRKQNTKCGTQNTENLEKK